MMEKDFGEVLRERREQLDMTQKELARSAGISDAYVCTIERGSKLPPSDEICARLEEALGMPDGELVALSHRQRTNPDILAQMDLEKLKRRFENTLDKQIARLYNQYWEIMLRAAMGTDDRPDDPDEVARIRERFSQAVAERIEAGIADVPHVHRNEFKALGEEILEKWGQRYHDLSRTLTAAVAGASPASPTVVHLDEEAGELLTGDELLLSQGRPIPVLNAVSAGYPVMRTDLDFPTGFAESYVYDPTVKSATAFGLEVVGDSMEPRFHEGDIVVFDPGAHVAGGDFCFVKLRESGETTFKQVFFDTADTVRLQPVNAAHPPQVIRRNKVDKIYKLVRRMERF